MLTQKIKLKDLSSSYIKYEDFNLNLFAGCCLRTGFPSWSALNKGN